MFCDIIPNIKNKYKGLRDMSRTYRRTKDLWALEQYNQKKQGELSYDLLSFQNEFFNHPIFFKAFDKKLERIERVNFRFNLDRKYWDESGGCGCNCFFCYPKASRAAYKKTLLKDNKKLTKAIVEEYWDSYSLCWDFDNKCEENFEAYIKDSVSFDKYWFGRDVTNYFNEKKNKMNAQSIILGYVLKDIDEAKAREQSLIKKLKESLFSYDYLELEDDEQTNYIKSQICGTLEAMDLFVLSDIDCLESSVSKIVLTGNTLVIDKSRIIDLDNINVAKPYGVTLLYLLSLWVSRHFNPVFNYTEKNNG